MKSAIRHTIFAVFLGSLSALAAAGPGDEPAKRTVHFADLDLSHGAGVAVLYSRIQSAAREVCRPANARELKSIMIARQCVEQATARAVAEVNAPMLTSYYLQKTGVPLTVARR
jgi:UrcA family protein